MNNNIYLDHYRTTRLSKSVYDKMKPFLEDTFYLPVSFTEMGTQAAEAVEESVERVRQALNAENAEIIFTSGGTEANNLVIHGSLRDEQPEETTLITSVIDHPSIVNTYDYYKKKGFGVKKIRVDDEGFWKMDELETALNETTRLVSITYVNHTIGTIQKIDEIAKMVRERAPKARIHLDGAMALLSVEMDLEKLDVDFITLSGHKIYGPKGTGVIVSRKKGALKPVLFGTVVTSPFKPGADNLPGIVGISHAVREAVQNREQYVEKNLRLQKKLMKMIEDKIPNVRLNGPVEQRAVDNVNYSFRQIEGESIMMFLDFEGIVVATGSACASSDLKVNYILSAIGRDHEMAHGSLRITTGRENTEADIERFVKELVPIVERLREQSTIK